MIFDNFVQCLKTFWETCVTYATSERLGCRSFRTEDMPLPIIASTSAWVAQAVLGLCTLIPLADMTACLGLQTPVWMARPNTGPN
jgi:hypothetical protein